MGSMGQLFIECRLHMGLWARALWCHLVEQQQMGRGRARVLGQL